jgi:beta-xylosidase
LQWNDKQTFAISGSFNASHAMCGLLHLSARWVAGYQEHGCDQSGGYHHFHSIDGTLFFDDQDDPWMVYTSERSTDPNHILHDMRANSFIRSFLLSFKVVEIKDDSSNSSWLFQRGTAWYSMPCGA